MASGVNRGWRDRVPPRRFHRLLGTSVFFDVGPQIFLNLDPLQKKILLGGDSRLSKFSQPHMWRWSPAEVAVFDITDVFARQFGAAATLLESSLVTQNSSNPFFDHECSVPSQESICCKIGPNEDQVDNFHTTATDCLQKYDQTASERAESPPDSYPQILDDNDEACIIPTPRPTPAPRPPDDKCRAHPPLILPLRGRKDFWWFHIDWDFCGLVHPLLELALTAQAVGAAVLVASLEAVGDAGCCATGPFFAPCVAGWTGGVIGLVAAAAAADVAIDVALLQRLFYCDSKCQSL